VWTFLCHGPTGGLIPVCVEGETAHRIIVYAAMRGWVDSPSRRIFPSAAWRNIGASAGKSRHGCGDLNKAKELP